MNWGEIDGIEDRLGWVDQNDQPMTIRELVNSVLILTQEIKDLRIRVCDLEPKDAVNIRGIV